jgi:hypothetical protein
VVGPRVRKLSDAIPNARGDDSPEDFIAPVAIPLPPSRFYFLFGKVGGLMTRWCIQELWIYCGLYRRGHTPPALEILLPLWQGWGHTKSCASMAAEKNPGCGGTGIRGVGAHSPPGCLSRGYPMSMSSGHPEPV